MRLVAVFALLVLTFSSWLVLASLASFVGGVGAVEALLLLLPALLIGAALSRRMLRPMR